MAVRDNTKSLVEGESRCYCSCEIEGNDLKVDQLIDSKIRGVIEAEEEARNRELKQFELEEEETLSEVEPVEEEEKLVSDHHS